MAPLYPFIIFSKSSTPSISRLVVGSSAKRRGAWLENAAPMARLVFSPPLFTALSRSFNWLKSLASGSSSVSPLMEKLIEAYKTVNPNATLELQTTDSTTGVSGALDGTYTIGMASRELKDSEVEGGAKATVLAKDGIAVIVSNDNPIDNLTVDQIKGIYTGELTTWADVQ